MARAARRESLVVRMKAEVDRLDKENFELRKAAGQLMAGLTEYAKVQNWKTELGDDGIALRYVWVGEGEGAKVARKFLGLEEDNERRRQRTKLKGR